MRKNKLYLLLLIIPLLLSCEKTHEQNIHSVEKKIIVALGYHAIGNKNSGYTITRDKFENQVNFLRDNGYQSIGIDDLANYLYKKNDIPAKSFILTFDDGSISGYNYVFPYLVSNKLKAIFFIPTNSIGTEGYLNPGQIQEMNETDCCDFGSHSVSHKNLFTLEADKLVEELNRSKETLEQITGEEIFSFAYPNGFLTEREVTFLKKQNYKLAFSVLPGLNDTPGSPFEISRIVISAKTSMEDFKAMVTGDPAYYRRYYSQMYSKSAQGGLQSIARLCKNELSKYAK